VLTLLTFLTNVFISITVIFSVYFFFQDPRKIMFDYCHQIVWILKEEFDEIPYQLESTDLD